MASEEYIKGAFKQKAVGGVETNAGLEFWTLTRAVPGICVVSVIPDKFCWDWLRLSMLKLRQQR